MIKQCRVCQVPLEGARELDEGNGNICLACMIYDARSALEHRLMRRISELEARIAKLEKQ